MGTSYGVKVLLLEKLQADNEALSVLHSLTILYTVPSNLSPISNRADRNSLPDEILDTDFYCSDTAKPNFFHFSVHISRHRSSAPMVQLSAQFMWLQRSFFTSKRKSVASSRPSQETDHECYRTLVTLLNFPRLNFFWMSIVFIYLFLHFITLVVEICSRYSGVLSVLSERD